jgi:CheY-like chemotaxis protein
MAPSSDSSSRWTAPRRLASGRELSLTGNLEDLPLLDILQIVSFSKKTGWLGIRAAAGDGAIVFREGFVVASFAWDSPPFAPQQSALPAGAREPLVRRRIEAALEQLIRLREGQFQFSLAEQPPTRIGARDISLETLDPGINPQELLLDLARGMDEDRRDSSAALEEAFSGSSAETSFADVHPAEPSPAAPAPPEPAPAAPAPPVVPTPFGSRLPGMQPGEYTLPVQAIPEELLRALPARAAATPAPASEPVPEAVRSEWASPPAPAAQPPAPPPAAAAPPGPAPAEPAAAKEPARDEVRALLLVDDEDDVRQLLAQAFAQEGWQVVEAEDPDAAIKKAQRLAEAQIAFVLVCDLGMPTSGGASFHGGFEVVKRLGKMHLKPPVLMMSDSLSGSVRARARQMGIANLVFKPGLSKLDAEQHERDLKVFARGLLLKELPELARQIGAAPAPRSRAKAEQAANTSEDQARDFRVLQQYLPELKGVAEPQRISTLVMKVAREFFERGVLFLVKDEKVRGLGGFGPGGVAEGANAVAKLVEVPLSEPSFFLDVVSSAKPLAGALPAGHWTDEVMSRLGRFRANGAALLPLVAHHDTIAILFGDNPETGRPLGRLDALELYVAQAGTALENALLQRKLRSVQEKG